MVEAAKLSRKSDIPHSASRPFQLASCVMIDLPVRVRDRLYTIVT